MTGRPAPVAIDDLAQPRYSDEVRAILDFMADVGTGLRLEPAALMADAEAQTGLADFGDDEFVDRLELLCRALRSEARLSAAGVTAQHALLGQLLRNRLLVEDLVRRHPEILEEPITAPIVICGLPRTGTTHLHNLLSADPALRSLPYWESLEPVLAPAEAAALAGRPDAEDPRRLRTEQALAFLDAAMPHFKRMHEMTVDHVHEEIQLLAIDFSSMLFETIAPMPSWRDAYLARDQRPSYAYLRKVLQVLQWLRGGDRWVLKSPQHLEQFPALVDTFPDATFVVTHRDPVSVTASMVMMLAYSARLSHDPVDLEWIGSYWAARLETMLGACVVERDALPAERTVDVRFDEFMADELAMVERIYSLAGRPLTAQGRGAMAAFTERNPRGRHGTVRYEWAPFGLDPAERRKALSFYVERFGVTEES